MHLTFNLSVLILVFILLTGAFNDNAPAKSSASPLRKTFAKPRALEQTQYQKEMETSMGELPHVLEKVAVDSMLFSPKDNVNDPAIPIRLTMDTLIDDMCNNSVQLIELSKNLNDGFINLDILVIVCNNKQKPRIMVNGERYGGHANNFKNTFCKAVTISEQFGSCIDICMKAPEYLGACEEAVCYVLVDTWNRFQLERSQLTRVDLVPKSIYGGAATDNTNAEDQDRQYSKTSREYDDEILLLQGENMIWKLVANGHQEKEEACLRGIQYSILMLLMCSILLVLPFLVFQINEIQNIIVKFIDTCKSVLACYKKWRSSQAPVAEDETVEDTNPSTERPQEDTQYDPHSPQQNRKKRVYKQIPRKNQRWVPGSQQYHHPSCQLFSQSEHPIPPNIRPQNSPRIDPRRPNLPNRHMDFDNDPNVGLPALFPDCVYRTRNIETRRHPRTYHDEDVVVHFKVVGSRLATHKRRNSPVDYNV